MTLPERHPHIQENVLRFYQSDVVIDRFELGFEGRWHTRIVPDAPGPKSSEDYVCSLLGLGAEHHVLDFGCGVGVVACSMAERLGCSVRGLNIAAKHVERARRLARERGLADRVEFDLYEGGILPYREPWFDRISFFESPCHVVDKELWARELFRVLAPGGVCAGQDWVLANADTSPSDYRDWVHPIEASCEVSLCSLARYAELFERAGFTNVEVIDARDIYRDMARAFTRPSGVPIRVTPEDGMAERLAKGNVALSNAFHRGLFSVGFVRAEKPGRRTSVQSAVTADGRDLETGRIEVFSLQKNVSVIQHHRQRFGVPDHPVLGPFLDLVRASDGCTTEVSCKLEGGERHSARFNLFFHQRVREPYGAIRSYFDRVARETDVRLDLGLVDAFLGPDFDFERASKVVTGLDLRAGGGSRLKLWFMLTRYPERVERALGLQGDDRARALFIHDEFLVGFDLGTDGQSSIKLYPDLRPEELGDSRIAGAFTPAAMAAMAECRRVHVYLRARAPRVLQLHPSDPDAFVARHLSAELALPVHAAYRGARLLDMVVSVREADLGAGRIEDFALYYMPAEPLGGP